LGIVFLIIWAVRVLDKKQLKKWVVTLLAVGLLGMLLSSALMFTGGNWDRDGKGLKDGESWGLFGGCRWDDDEAAEEVSDEAPAEAEEVPAS